MRPSTRRARPALTLLLLVAGCTSSGPSTPATSPAAATAVVHLADLRDDEQVLDTQPTGDARVGWALTQRRVLRTTDDGGSWTEIAGPWRTPPVLAAFTTPDAAVLVEATPEGGIAVHRTTDAGRTFSGTPLSTSVGSVPRSLAATDPQHLTLIVGFGDPRERKLDVLVPPRLLTTADGGATWTDHPAAPVDAAWIAADGTGYANGTGEFRGLHRVDGPDAPWQRLTPPGDDETGPGGGPSYRLVARHDQHIVVESHLPTGMQVRYRLLASDDAGTTWRTIDGPPTSYFGTGTITSTAELGPGHLLTAAQSVDIGIVADISDDDGRTWTTHRTGSCAGRIQLRTAPPRRVWIVGDLSACEGSARDGATRLARSTDGGLTWTRSDPEARHTKPR